MSTIANRLLLFIFVVTFDILHSRNDFKPFDDTVLYKLSWNSAEHMPESLIDRYDRNQLDSDAVVLISTGSDERYLCTVPEAPLHERPKIEQYQGPSPAELIAPLYQQRSCTYRIEMYWTYELCHGRFLQQYHEEKDTSPASLKSAAASNGRPPTRSEYYLGQYRSDFSEPADFDQLNPPTRKIEDQQLPYYPVRMAQGTVCDITGKPRGVNILYMCVNDAKNQIYSLTEISSCEYEVIVLTNRLCAHPAFQPQMPKEHEVACYPVDGAKTKPTSLVIWEAEQHAASRQQYSSVEHDQQSTATVSADATTDGDDDDDDDDVDNDLIVHEVRPKGQQHPVEPAYTVRPPDDHQLATSFLSGQYCLYGGAGWWKHEYCHGKHVIQFHEEQQQSASASRAEIVLGVWDKNVHLQWIAESPHKKPIRVDGKIRQVSHLYAGGDVCHETNTHRSVEVRLRCRETQGNPNAVTLYLLEPRLCEYILGVESAMFCDVLQMADEHGLIQQHPSEQL